MPLTLAIHYAIARLAFQRGDFSKCERLLAAELERAPAAGSPRLEAAIWNLYGIAAARQARYSDAATRYQRSLTIHRQRGDTGSVAQGLNNLGNVWKNLGQPSVALELHLEALKLRRELQDEGGITQSMSNIELVYRQLGDLASALIYSNEALQRARKLSDLAEFQRISINHADLLARSGKALAARDLLDGLEPHLDQAAPLLRRAALSVRAQILQTLGKPTEALALAEQAVALARDMGEPKELSEALETRAKLQAPEAAEATFIEAADLAQSGGAVMRERELRLHLAALLEKRGAFAEALAQWRRMEQLSEAAGALATARRVAVLERQLAEAERARELGQLRATESIQAALISRQRWVGALGMVSLLSVSLLLGWRMREVRRRQVIAERNRAELSAKNTELEQLANTDALTGLGNRKWLREHLERLASADEAKTLALLDIDFFKRINDTYGHDVGDRVLVALSEALRRSLPKETLIGRWGGEEFLLLFPGTNSPAALESLARVREALTKLHIPAAEETVQVRFSAGIATHNHPVFAEAWLKAADVALYRAKELGRDRIELAS
jgi:diguanylate cyclase (GGDEF)-like protein